MLSYFALISVNIHARDQEINNKIVRKLREEIDFLTHSLSLFWRANYFTESFDKDHFRRMNR